MSTCYKLSGTVYCCAPCTHYSTGNNKALLKLRIRTPIISNYFGESSLSYEIFPLYIHKNTHFMYTIQK